MNWMKTYFSKWHQGGDPGDMDYSSEERGEVFYWKNGKLFRYWCKREGFYLYQEKKKNYFLELAMINKNYLSIYLKMIIIYI